MYCTKKQKAWGRNGLCLGDQCLLFVSAFVYKQLSAADFARLKILFYFLFLKRLTNWNFMNGFKLDIFQWLADTKDRVVTPWFFLEITSLDLLSYKPFLD